MCATVLVNWVDRVYKGGLRSNTAIYGQVEMLQACNRLHHHIDSADVFFSDAVAQTKRSRDIVVHREDKGALGSLEHVDVLRKRQIRSFKVCFPLRKI